MKRAYWKEAIEVCSSFQIWFPFMGRFCSVVNTETELEENLKKLLAEKEKLVQEISPESIKRYESIATTKDGLAVVSVEGDHCGGCHVLLPSQVYEDLARDDRMVTCGSCGRILYLQGEERSETESETTTKDIR